MTITSSTISRSWKGTRSRISLPASIFEKSRMSLMMVSRISDDLRMVFRWSRCWRGRRLFSSNSVKPIMPFSGVRISWDMLARNSDLIRLASSASLRAKSSSMFWISMVSRVSRRSPVAWSMFCCISAWAWLSSDAISFRPDSSCSNSGPARVYTRVSSLPSLSLATASFSWNTGSVKARLRRRETYQALLISLMLVVGGVLLSLLVSLRLSRAFTVPVFQLNEAVAKLKEGKLDTRVYTRAGPEFEQLESGLNEMASELSQAQAEIQQNIDQATGDLRETLETIEIQNIELDFARKEALEASRIKSEFLANMSHEIRTPLNGIIGFTELLLKSPLPRQQRDHLNTIRKSSEILLTIINDILDFSKIEAGKLILDRVPFQLRDIVEEVMVMLAPAAHAKNLDLVPLVYNDVPDNIMGDPLRVKQVITNLVNNAIKFTQTGEVVLRASLEDEDKEANRVTLRLSVTDSGVGLSRAQQQSLFNAFSQADASIVCQYGGTGLGLAISKRLVEEMGGEIGLESELGRGST